MTTEQLNALRTRLHNFGLANWVGKPTTTDDYMLRVAEACVQALDQFDRYEVEIARLKLAPGGTHGAEPNASSPESGTGAAPRVFSEMPNPTETDLADPEFEAIWQTIKRWDVNVPGCYAGYCGANGSHAMLILNALRKSRQVR